MMAWMNMMLEGWPFPDNHDIITCSNTKNGLAREIGRWMKQCGLGILTLNFSITLITR